MRTGLLWLPIDPTDPEELKYAREHFREQYGADKFTGKIYARNPQIPGIRQDSTITPGLWLFEFAASPQQDL